MLEDEKWQAPLYCFEVEVNAGGSGGSFMRGISHSADAMDAVV